MSTTSKARDPMAVSAALCVDTEGMERLGAVLRYLSIGLVDQAVQVRLLSPDMRIEGLTLGPIQTLVHDRITWPGANRRTRQLVEALAHAPPTVAHALSAGSYRTAAVIAEAFDADLVLQVTSLADCDAIATLDRARVQRFVVASQPLFEVLETQLGITPESIELVRPGVLAQGEASCFSRPGHDPTILCTAGFRRGSGVDRLIKAVRMLQQRDRPVLLFLLGKGSYEPLLRRLVREQRLSSCVTFAHPLGDVAPAMRSADIFVEPAPGTAFTVGSLQAMAAGMAVVTCVNSVCEHFRDGETTVVSPEATSAALADAIERLLADHAFARRIALTAQEYLRAHHSTSPMAERTAALYRQIALARATFPLAQETTGG